MLQLLQGPIIIFFVRVLYLNNMCACICIDSGNNYNNINYNIIIMHFDLPKIARNGQILCFSLLWRSV